MPARKVKKTSPKKTVQKTTSKHSFWGTVIIMLVLVNAIFLTGWLLSL